MEAVTGGYLRELRENLGLSQVEVARLAGISQAHVAKIEGGKVDPRLSTVNRIITVLLSRERTKTCREVMSRRIIKVSGKDRLNGVIGLMKKFAISQIPVFERGKPVGSVRESTIIKNMGRNLRMLKVRDVLDEMFPVVNAQDSMDILWPLLEFHPAVLVSEKGKIVGIVTKSNLLGMNNEK